MFSFVYGNLDFAHKLDRASSPKDEYWKHMHYFYEVLYFIAGDVNYQVDSAERQLRKGDLLIIHPGKFHFATVNRAVNYERYVLKFPEEMVDEPFRSKLGRSQTFFTLSLPLQELIQECDSIQSTYPPDEAAMLMKARIQELLIRLLQNSDAQEVVKDNPISSNIINYIDQNITQDLSLSSIAQALNYSPSYLASIFKKNLNTPMMQYIRTKKMIFARTLLKRGESPEKVAEILAFEDYSTFYRSYMKVIGESPSKTRKS